MIAEAAQATRTGTHWIVVLAAGGSRRLGRPKQLVRHRGEALVLAAARRALATRPAGVVVVTGSRAGRVAAAVRTLPVVVTRNARWREGLAASLQAGLRRVPRTAPLVLVTTVDQWAVDVRDLRALLSAARGGRVAAAAYDGIRGIPAAFPRSARSALRAARGDRGARAFLQSSDVREVAVPRAALDLDVPADLATLRASRLNAPTAPLPRATE